MKFKVEERENYTLIEFQLEGPIAPKDLKDLELPKVDSTKGVILSGRGPIWLYTYMVHFYHPTAWIATYDPRLGGGVVVASHKPGVSEGDVIPV